jgi:ferredoxin
MNGRRLLLLLSILCGLAAGALLGWRAGPALSKAHYIVQVAERVWLEESQGLTEQTRQSEAYRKTGLPSEHIYRQAREIRGRFQIGGALFGLWCALTAGSSLGSIFSRRPPREYEPDPAHCLACGRCYLSCPVERERRKQECGAGSQPAGADAARDLNA